MKRSYSQTRLLLWAMILLAYMSGFLSNGADHGESGHSSAANFTCSTSFAQGRRFESILVNCSSAETRMNIAIRPFGSGFVSSVVDPKTKRSLFLWSGASRNQIAYGWRDPERSGGLLPGGDNLSIVDSSGNQWRSFSEVPPDVVQNSQREIASVSWLQLRDDVVDGFPTIVFLEKFHLQHRLCGKEGGSVWIGNDNWSKAMVLGFEYQQLVSAERMSGKKRDGLCLGWKSGMLIQRGLFADGVGVDGVFVEKLGEEGVSLVLRKQSKLIRQWIVPAGAFDDPTIR